jgi:2-succinyl-5-enolpyruvyl-6-hydroxy-3-cyclohexene-1-carboxylate synthase
VTSSPRWSSASLADALVEALWHAGVRHLCVCPGGRSGPIVFAVDRAGGFTTSVHLDERAGGFWALGYARITGTPVALVCTSGSALANLMPAVVEARAAGIPLVVVTGDRPDALQDCGAPQTLHQQGFFGVQVVDHAHFTVELLAAGAERVRRRVLRIVDRGRTAPGPVHLNVAFEEPLGATPSEGARPAWRDAGALAGEGERGDVRPSATFDRYPAAVRETIVQSRRPLIVVGPEAGLGAPAALHAAVRRLARTIGAPVIVDALSGLRGAEDAPVEHDDRGSDSVLSVIAAGALWFEHIDATPTLRPDLILRFGAIPPSRAFAEWTDRVADVQHLFVDPWGLWRDPNGTRAEFVHDDVASFCAYACAVREEARAAPAASQWSAAWQRIESAARDAARDGEVPEESQVMRTVAEQLSPNDLLHVASSMPIRDLDAWVWETRAGRVTSNRGTNGIDGTVSTAVGQAVAWRSLAPKCDQRRAWVVVGDVAALHDLNALAVHDVSGLRLTIVVVNNDGGGIFGFLPWTGEGPLHDRFFRTRHGRTLEAMASVVGAPWIATGPEGVGAALAASRRHDGPVVIEVTTDPERNRAAWRAAKRRVAQAARAVLSDLPPLPRDDVSRATAASDPFILSAARGERDARWSCVALHGFRGRPSDFVPLQEALGTVRCHAIELPGHGPAPVMPPVGAWRDAVHEAIERWLDHAAHGLPTVGVGYSMGGRLLLDHAIRSARLDALVVIGAGPGIADPDERAARGAVDADRIERLMRDGVPAFLAAWEAMPLLAPSAAARAHRLPGWAELARQDHTAEGLAGALRAFGPAAMPFLGGADGRFHDPHARPILWVVGAEDAAWRARIEDAALAHPNLRGVCIEGAGHAVHLDQPRALADAIEGFVEEWVEARPVARTPQEHTP